MKVRSEGANLEVADVEPYRCCQARAVGISNHGLGAGVLEPQAHRLRPEGLSLRATFVGIPKSYPPRRRSGFPMRPNDFPIQLARKPEDKSHQAHPLLRRSGVRRLGFSLIVPCRRVELECLYSRSGGSGKYQSSPSARRRRSAFRFGQTQARCRAYAR